MYSLKQSFLKIFSRKYFIKRANTHWVRPDSLSKDKIENYIQVVGHYQKKLTVTNDVILLIHWEHQGNVFFHSQSQLIDHFIESFGASRLNGLNKQLEGQRFTEEKGFCFNINFYAN